MKKYSLSLGCFLAYSLSSLSRPLVDPSVSFVGAFTVVTTTSHRRRPLSTTLAMVLLEPEPPGGTELQPIATTVSPNSRVKQLDDASTESNNGQPIFSFWMTTAADGKLIQEIRQTILKDASKKANFPGFRKGQVPPYAQPQITQFAIQESIIQTVQAMVSAYGLQSLPGSDGQVQVHEDVAQMASGYKAGTDLFFTATLQASYDESKIRQTATPDDNIAVDSVVMDAVVVEDPVDNVAVDNAVMDAEVVEDPLGNVAVDAKETASL